MRRGVLSLRQAPVFLSCTGINCPVSGRENLPGRRGRIFEANKGTTTPRGSSLITARRGRLGMVPAMTGEDDMKLKDILTPEKVAEKFEVTVETVLDWRKLGMPWVKIGKSIYIFEDSLLRWAKAHEIDPNAQNAPKTGLFAQGKG